jgi:hypothetical protein
MTKKIETAAERYRAVAKQEEAEIVDVIPPSGFVFKFRKPSAFTMLFGLGELPQFAASEAARRWTTEGVLKPGDGDDPEVLKVAKMLFEMRDMVLELSHSPKLVLGKANEANDELSTDDVADTDLAYLLAWFQAGGDTSKLLVTFPRESPEHADAGPNRKERRAAAKHSSGSQG